jgi:hypothetical protein
LSKSIEKYKIMQESPLATAIFESLYSLKTAVAMVVLSTEKFMIVKSNYYIKIIWARCELLPKQEFAHLLNKLLYGSLV